MKRSLEVPDVKMNNKYCKFHAMYICSKLHNSFIDLTVTCSLFKQQNKKLCVFDFNLIANRRIKKVRFAWATIPTNFPEDSPNLTPAITHAQDHKTFDSYKYNVVSGFIVEISENLHVFLLFSM